MDMQKKRALFDKLIILYIHAPVTRNEAYYFIEEEV